MLFLGTKSLLLVMALIIPSGWLPLGVSGQRGASAADKNGTAECWDEKFACTRLYSVHRPVKQCVHQVCFTR
ncbi:Mfap5 [Phodopus roborovskii]|uniref:Mfap5 protein n=1 Tax=Phodopus roborovskii TaxID=109678 RepID=A0AAV0A5W0_PHORO|nr:Mfap5 [Phodopus roborovskii]